MGRKWVSAVKKIFSVEPKENKNLEIPKKKCEKSKDVAKGASDFREDSAIASSLSLSLASPSLNQSLSDAEKGQTKHARSIAMATDVAAEAATVAAQAVPEVARLTTLFKLKDNRSREEVAATKIQASVRGYMARKASSALKGLVRLRLLSNSIAVKRQTSNTLHCTQALTRVQLQLGERRLRLSEENQALHKQRQLKREKELEQLKFGEDWVDSPKTKEQLEAKLLKRQEAALRRERSLAYAYSHQWRCKSTRSKNATFIDPTNQQWSWSWLDRWMAARPWEGSRCITDRSYFSNHSSKKSGDWKTTGDFIKVPCCRQSRPRNCTVQSSFPSMTTNDDTRRLLAFQSEQHRRRHSIGGSFSIGDEDRLTSLSTITKYRFQAPSAGKTWAKAGSLKGKQMSFPEAGLSKKHVPYPANASRLSTSPKSLAM